MNLLQQKILQVHKEEEETEKNGVMLVTFADVIHVVSEQCWTVRTNIEFAGAALEE